MHGTLDSFVGSAKYGEIRVAGACDARALCGFRHARRLSEHRIHFGASGPFGERSLIDFADRATIIRHR